MPACRSEFTCPACRIFYRCEQERHALGDHTRKDHHWGRTPPTRRHCGCRDKVKP